MLSSCFRRVNVFGVGICVTENAWNHDSGIKASHIANVLAQYLDNDGDGQVDDSDVVSKMIDNKAVLFVPMNEDDMEQNM
jgi:hypothetical protein